MSPDDDDWDAHDPRLRSLRTIAGIVLLVLLIYAIVFDPEPDVISIGTVSGMLLVILGFEVGLNWPRPGGRS